MSDWLDGIIARARERRPIACAGCGRTWDRADMLEATLPSFTVKGDEHFRMSFTLSSVRLVGPCCSELANRWQPGDPEPGP